MTHGIWHFASLFSCALVACAPAAETVPLASAPCQSCAHPEAAEPLDSDGLLPARTLAQRDSLDTTITSTAGGPHASHVRTGPTVEIAPFFDRGGSARWLFSTGLAFGAWGDQRHGRMMVQAATGPKLHLWGDLQFLDVYGLVTEGVVSGWFGMVPGRNTETGNVLGGGFGVDVFRAFSLELTGHWLYALDTPFSPDRGGQAARSLPELGISIGLDSCAFGTFCDRPPTPQRSVNGTCEIYLSAKAVCEQAEGASGRQELCQHAADALALKEDEVPPLARDAFKTFLHNLAQAEASTPRTSSVKGLAEKVDALAATDAELTAWRGCGREQERALAQRGQKVATHRVYSPYAVEAMRALGCQPDGTLVGKCSEYRCEDPPPTHAVCGGQ